MTIRTAVELGQPCSTRLVASCRSTSVWTAISSASGSAYPARSSSSRRHRWIRPSSAGSLRSSEAEAIASPLPPSISPNPLRCCHVVIKRARDDHPSEEGYRPSEAVRLEQAEPELRARGERGHRVPEVVERRLCDHRDRRGVERLGHLGAR